MTQVFLGLGSNIDPQQHIVAGLDALAQQFGELIISPVYESEAVGFDGDNFVNLVVGIDTGLSVGELSSVLKAIEDANGRERSGPKFSGRSLDIDILTYGEVCGLVDGVELPRDEVVKNAFVLQPLAQLAPQQRHPACGLSFAELWQAYNRPQKLWQIDFAWRGRCISQADSADGNTGDH